MTRNAPTPPTATFFLLPHSNGDSDRDSVSSIESSRCREMKYFQQEMLKLRSINSSLRKTVKQQARLLTEKDDALLQKDESSLEMQAVYERNMLDMLETKLSNISPPCSGQSQAQSKTSQVDRSQVQSQVNQSQGHNNSILSYAPAPADSRNGSTKKTFSSKIKKFALPLSGLSSSSRRSLLSFLKSSVCLTSKRSIPKYVIVSISDDDNMSTLTA